MSLVHLSGEYTPEKGQHCVRCGEQLSAPRRRLAWEEGSEPPKGWANGVEIYVDGNFWLSLEHAEDPDAFNEDPRCSVS